MKRNREKASKWISFLMLSMLLVICGITSLSAQSRLTEGTAEFFAALPAGSTGPEGLTVGPDGTVYVSTFGFTKDVASSSPGHLIAFRDNGALIRDVVVSGASPHLIGLNFNPVTGDLLIVDFPNKAALKVDPVTGASSVFMTVSGNAFLNDLTFDRAGNVYVSDSVQGIIWKAGPQGGPGVAWISDPLLTSTGFPPFGANGLRFNHAQDTLFVTNTGNGTVIEIPVANGNPGKPSVFVNGAITADGLAIDSHENLWIVANQADEIIVVNPGGKVIARSGEFEGMSASGQPRGLLFPASIAFSPDGNTAYISNLSLNVEILGLTPAVDTPWTKLVNSYTISKMRVRLQPDQE
ncbi:MAG TPA: SMP-30/gluconolactonase/LRE family protein [Candidatus Angelobacter sp.]|nr:SMP-30/gluconolactonase/LRE family protein [Candidatus Angelobacter sp.]